MSKTPKNTNSNTFIYVLKDPKTNDIRYVGKTTNDINIRLSQHIYSASKQLKRNHRLNWIQSIINNGLKPIIEIIFECPWEKSQEEEQKWIKYYRDLNYDLVNETDGGEGNLGYKKSNDTIKKLKASLRKDLPKIYQYTLNGEFIKEWACVREASEILHISSAGIRRNAIGERKKYKDFIWSFEQKENVLPYSRAIINSSNAVNTKHSEIAKLIKQEDVNLNCDNVFAYDENNVFVYEAISLIDMSKYLIDELKWTQKISTLKTGISNHINSKTRYNTFYFTYESPNSNHIVKSGKILHLKAYNYDTDEFLFEECGLTDFCTKFDLIKTNVINNIKNKTKFLMLGNTKIKVKCCPINENH